MAEEITSEIFLNEWNETKKGVVQYMDRQESLCISMDLDKKGLGTIYESAYNAFKAEDYPQAENLFFSLFLLDFKDHNFQIGLGAVYEAQEKFENAISMYTLAMMTGKQTPELLFRTGKCLLATGQKEEAKIVFALAVELGVTNRGSDGTKGLEQLVAIEKSKKILALLNN